VSTFGKAMGSSGACVAGPAVVIDYLVQKSRPFMFSTASPLLLLNLVQSALDLLAEPGRRRRVLALADHLRSALESRGLPRPVGRGPIVPVRIGDNRLAVAVADAMQSRGFDLRAVRPPTVPPGHAGLRISVHANHHEAELDQLAVVLAESMEALLPQRQGAEAVEVGR
jgi:8-amino-7-oxononanoate synthase